MTVAELITHLQTFPPDLPVLVDGYESGLVDITPEQIAVIAARLNVREGDGVTGPHEMLELWDIEDGLIGAPAVLISRSELP